MKTPVKISMKVQRIAGALSRVSIWNANHLYVYFCRIGSSLIFFAGGCVTYQIENIMFPRISWEGSSLSHFPSRKKIPCFREKNTTFPDSARKIMSRCDPSWKDHLFRTFEENIIFLCIFLRKTIFHFPSEGKIIFSGKINIIFPDNTRKIKFQRNFFGKTIFSGRLEKENMVFHAVYRKL